MRFASLHELTVSVAGRESIAMARRIFCRYVVKNLAFHNEQTLVYLHEFDLQRPPYILGMNEIGKYRS